MASISRLLGVFEVFITQTTMFYVQWTWMTAEYFTLATKTSINVNGAATIWLRIETYAYYSLILGTAFYIVLNQMIQACKNEQITDFSKQF